MEFSQLIHIFSLMGLIEKNIQVIDGEPSKIYLLTSNILLKFKFIFRRNEFDCRNL